MYIMHYVLSREVIIFAMLGLGDICHLEIFHHSDLCSLILIVCTLNYQFRPPIALRTDLSHITTELWEIPVLRMAH